MISMTLFTVLFLFEFISLFVYEYICLMMPFHVETLLWLNSRMPELFIMNVPALCTFHGVKQTSFCILFSFYLFHCVILRPWPRRRRTSPNSQQGDGRRRMLRRRARDLKVREGAARSRRRRRGAGARGRTQRPRPPQRPPHEPQPGQPVGAVGRAGGDRLRAQGRPGPRPRAQAQHEGREQQRDVESRRLLQVGGTSITCWPWVKSGSSKKKKKITGGRRIIVVQPLLSLSKRSALFAPEHKLLGTVHLRAGRSKDDQPSWKISDLTG